MPSVIATDRSLLWAVTTGNETLAAGLMELGGLTVTGNDKTLLSDVSENAFLGKVAGKGGSYNPLPNSGWLEAGDIYGYGGGLVMVRQSHNRTEHAPADVPALFTVYREGADAVLDWVAGEAVLVGTRRTYDGKTYEAIQAHQTQFSPDLVPALWREVVETPPGPQAWAQPTGAHDAYALNALVTHNGQTWQSLYDSNVWEPGIFGWSVV